MRPKYREALQIFTKNKHTHTYTHIFRVDYKNIKNSNEIKSERFCQMLCEDFHVAARKNEERRRRARVFFTVLF